MCGRIGSYEENNENTKSNLMDDTLSATAANAAPTQNHVICNSYQIRQDTHFLCNTCISKPTLCVSALL
ncbi:hypothetical protein X975_14851, partial [Stegodyphus mimosarum]